MTAARAALFAAALTLALPACAQPPTTGDRPAEATSLLGEPLRRPALTDAQRGTLEANLAEARAALEERPGDEMAWVWVGRRLAYLGRYNDAIEHYTEALEKFPESYKLLRHRGHRSITMREFEKAEADLDRAARLAAPHPDAPEPDGIPNERNEPRSTTNSNIYYHLALARYLQGRFAEAGDTWELCLRFSKNDDMICASRYWLWLSRQRDGADWGTLEAIARPIDEGMDIVENHAYHRLLLLFKGELREQDLAGDLDAEGLALATIAYGVARHRAFEGDEAGCRELLEKIVEGEMWPAFGHIAAEADLARQERGD